jgi:hypothetical protein
MLFAFSLSGKGKRHKAQGMGGPGAASVEPFEVVVSVQVDDDPAAMLAAAGWPMGAAGGCAVAVGEGRAVALGSARAVWGH